ncbi:MAG: hypothetical protein IJ740_16800 [Ruminococcus sp.]|nr:hypothetical protein [Ruminococcus sp.]
MIVLHGRSDSDEKVEGYIKFYRRDVFEPLLEHREDAIAEYERFARARDTAAEELELLHDIATKRAGTYAAEIFEIQRMMVEDGDYSSIVGSIIKSQQCTAEFAVKCAAKIFADLLRFSGSDYMAKRSEDVFFTADRIIRKLAGVEKRLAQYGDKKVILCADTLSSSDVLLMQSPNLCAFAFKKDTEQSHCVLLAQKLGIPTISDLGDGLEFKFEGREATLDCTLGTLVIE